MKKRSLWRASTVASLILIAVSTFLLFTSSKHPQEAEAQGVIARAKQLVVFASSDSIERAVMSDVLEGMRIVHLGDTSLLDQQNPIRFFLVITPSAVMPRGEGEGTALMVFQTEDLEKYGKVVILMSDSIRTLSHDRDVQATVLLHEIVHALQANIHLNRHETITDAVRFADEKRAWDIQLAIYRSIHPEVFAGITCDCSTGALSGMDTTQAAFLTGTHADNMARTLVHYSLCDRAMLMHLYSFVK